jgi:hypothetical protein
MGNNLIHFNTCAISYIVSTTNSHLYKIFDVYKAKEVKRGREDTMTFVINTDIMNMLMSEVGVNKEGNVYMCVCDYFMGRPVILFTLMTRHAP